MSHLFHLILTISVGSCAGILVIAALTMGYDTWQAFVISGVVGGAIGVVVAWYVARTLLRREAEHHPEDPLGMHPDNPYGLPKKPGERE